MPGEQVTVAIVVVGSEVLSGRVEDVNSRWLAIQLRKCGAVLTEICTIPDDVDIIAARVRELASSNRFVITAGGIGPTHDDVTYEGVAKAFGCGLQVRAEVVALLKRLTGSSAQRALDKSLVKLAMLPSKAVLVTNAADAYPVARVANVFILPGMPSLMRGQFDQFRAAFRGALRYHSAFRIGLPETDIVAALNSLVSAHPSVAVGSYPQESESPETVVSLEAQERGELVRAEAALSELVARVNPDVRPHRCIKASAAKAKAKATAATQSKL
ncbi:MoaB/Mog domain-containing protein [Tribonema minus]|uniref:MoaB/Mog domain-containing protein n=1 Tax=Tribonema minus TaxID=303371 RepID=A0A835Z9E0_9STRA|nr:MoaB/Mog domain-containing protein [Tribonema minus]